MLFIFKITSLTIIAFFAAMAWTPALTHFLYKHKLGKQIRDSKAAPIFAKLHAGKKGTPTMGGVLIWFTTLILALVFFYLADVFGGEFLSNLNFLSRGETLLPLGALVATALVGLVDDVMGIKGIGPKGGGLRTRHRWLIYTLIAIVGAWWFYDKLDWDLLRIPFLGSFNIGLWYIPIFVLVIVSTAHAVNLTDGLDGLAGGLLLTAFGAYGAIAFAQGKYDLAAFCGVIVGCLIAFLWFNIHPARFIMGDTGAMSLGVTLGIIAMLTNTALFLPVIGLVFVVETLSVIIQYSSRQIFKRKVFLIAPLHHHFEAKGWPECKVVMRFWLIGGVMAVAGLVLVLLDKI